MNMGIYMILNMTTEKYYIGRAFNFKDRWKKHRSDLNNNRHTNEYLQFAWNKYGEDDFKFFVLELIYDKLNIIEREQHWIDKMQSCDRAKGFNLNPSAANSIGFKHSIKTKNKLRELSLARGCVPPDPTGRKHSEASKLKISTSNRKPKLDTWSMKGRPDTRKLDKWPHELGSKCRCDDCRIKKNAQNLKSLQKRKPPRYLSYPEFAHLK